MTPELVIKQGTTRIVAVTKLRDAAGQPLDPSGWEIHAVARTGVWGPVAAEWVSGSPGPGQGVAEVVDADAAVDATVTVGEKWIYLYIPPAMSDGWLWQSAELDIELREPAPGLREETFSATLRITPTAVRE